MAEISSAVSGIREASVLIRTKAVITGSPSGLLCRGGARRVRAVLPA
jgi:hypothetical protein